VASLRRGSRKDGSTYVQVLYRLDGKQRSTSFEDLASAARFQKLADKFGPACGRPSRRSHLHYPWKWSRTLLGVTISKTKRGAYVVAV